MSAAIKGRWRVRITVTSCSGSGSAHFASSRSEARGRSRPRTPPAPGRDASPTGGQFVEPRVWNLPWIACLDLGPVPASALQLGRVQRVVIRIRVPAGRSGEAGNSLSRWAMAARAQSGETRHQSATRDTRHRFSLRFPLDGMATTWSARRSRQLSVDGLVGKVSRQTLNAILDTEAGVMPTAERSAMVRGKEIDPD